MTWVIRSDTPLGRGEWTIDQALDAAAARHGARAALIVGDRVWSYGELRSGALRVAAGLHSLGVSRGAKVGVLQNNGLEWVLVYYAVAYLGAVTVPLHTRYTSVEVAHVLRDAEVSTLFVGERYYPKMREICPDLTGAATGKLRAEMLPALKTVIAFGPPQPHTLEFEALLAHREDEVGPRPRNGADDVVMIKYTSGSTRFPKGVVLRHGKVLRNAFNAGERFALTPEDKIFSAMPFYHAGGSILTLLTALAHGASAVTLDHFDPDQALDAIESNRCTIHLGMDVMYLKESASPRFTTARIKSLRTGWIAASPEVAVVVHARMPFPFVNLYGMTELSGNCCMTHPDDPPHVRLEWAGEPQPGIEVAVFDPESERACAMGVPGEIRVRGWSVMDGYYRDAAATAAVIDDEGWFRTGDTGSIGETGYLKFTGRAKEMLKVGGENVSIAEVEACLQSHEKVRLAQVVGVPDVTYGEVPFAFVEVVPGRDCTETEIMDHCARQLARFKLPRYVRFVGDSDWPVTGPEKVQKPVLRTRALRDLGLQSGTA